MIPIPSGSLNLWRETPSSRLGSHDLVRRYPARSDSPLAFNEFFETSQFAIEENRKIGANPFFRFTVFPNYFDNSAGKDPALSYNVTPIAPDRIQVDSSVEDYALWFSGYLTANVFYLPTETTITWDYDFPGYDVISYFVTSNTLQDLIDWINTEGVSGPATINPISGQKVLLQKYYLFGFVFTPFRCFAFDTIEEAAASANSAYAVDAPGDAYDSYAADGSGTVAYVENIQIRGELRLPAQDILDGGTLSLPVSTDFSTLISADHTMRLLNRNNQYSPRHENFIFAGENDWQRKNLRIECGFKTPAGAETDTITLYVGSILKWGPAPLSITKDSYESGEVEIYSRDAISLFMDQMIGTPKDDGSPSPVVTGEILRQATKLGDNSLDTPVKDIDYEGNILDELSSIDLSGANNIIELSTTDPFEGLKCLRALTESAGTARGWINLPGATDQILFKTKIKFNSIPAPIVLENMVFLRIEAAGGNFLDLYVFPDYRVQINQSVSGWKATDWYINRNQDVWMDLALGIYGKNPGVIRLSIDGNQVLNFDKDEHGNPLDLTPFASILRVGVGLGILSAETWEVSFDNSQLFPVYYPEAYYVPGAPYQDIGTVYVDGTVKVEKVKNGITQTYSGGKAVDPVDMTKIPSQGLVVFGDLANPPSGSVFFMLDKDSNTHPVDSMQAVLIVGGRDSLINTTSFAAAKAARPDDSVGCYFESKAIADSILEIGKRALINIIIAQGEVKLLPYDGTAPAFYDWVIDRSVCAGLSPSDDSETKKNKINAKWGQYDQNSRLFYAAKDQPSIDKIGPFEEALDCSWGNEVGSDNGDMVKNRADCLLKRLKGSLVLYEDLVALAWKLIRAEIGDTTLVNIPYFGPAEIFRIVGKDVNMTPPYELKLTLGLYPGES